MKTKKLKSFLETCFDNPIVRRCHKKYKTFTVHSTQRNFGSKDKTEHKFPLVFIRGMKRIVEIKP